MTPHTVARQAPLSMGFSRKEYWGGLPFFLLQGIFPAQGLNLHLLNQQVDSLPLSHLGSPRRSGNGAVLASDKVWGMTRSVVAKEQILGSTKVKNLGVRWVVYMDAGFLKKAGGVEVETEAVSPGEDSEHAGGRQGSDLCTREASEERRVTGQWLGRGDRSVEEPHHTSGPSVQGVPRRKQSPFKD